MTMENNVKISVILPVFNGGEFIKEAIDSVVNQTFGDFELLVIDNCSTDSTAEIVKSYPDKRISYFRNDSNLGLIYSLNRGLSLCRAKYIARIDADDIALPERFRMQYDFLESHPEIGICGTSVVSFDNYSKKRWILHFPADDLPIRAFAFFQSPFNHPSVMFRREIIESNNLQYPNDLYMAEDYGLWTNLLQYTKGANLQTILMRYRKHNKSETTVADKVLNSRAQVVMKVQDKYLKYNNINLTPKQIEIFTLFTDRSMHFDLDSHNQKAANAVLTEFLKQLTENHKELLKDTIKNLSAISFYKFLKYRRLPLTVLFWKLFVKGGLYYARKIV